MGNLVTGERKVLQRWAEHFDELVNGHGDEERSKGEGKSEPENMEEYMVKEEENGTDKSLETTDIPTKEEVKAVVDKLKKSKAPGPDGIPSEILKERYKCMEHRIYELIVQIWNEERIPTSWAEALICPIQKKGDVQNCENSRGILLVNIAYKVLSIVLYGRLKPHANKIIGQYQCRFREGVSKIDQIYTLRQILEKTLEFQTETHHLFIDFKTAYDKVNRNQLYKTMLELGIPLKLVRLPQAMMEGTTAKFKIQNELSESFHIRKWLKQGDALARILFNITLEKIIRKANINQHGNIFYKFVQILAYADDIDIICRSLKSLQEVTIALDRAARIMRLEINQAKTKYMICGNKKKNAEDIFKVKLMTFERVNSFKYLGTLTTYRNDTSAEINNRIMLANRSYFGMMNMLKAKNINRKHKVTMYKTLIKPVLMYGAETWVLSKVDELSWSF